MTTRHCRRSGVHFELEATPARTHGQAAVWVAANSVGSLRTPTLIRPDNERWEKAHAYQKSCLAGAALVLTASRREPRATQELTTHVLQRYEEAHMSVSNIFNVFVRHLDVPGTSKAYRGDNGNIVVYETRAEAEAARGRVSRRQQEPEHFLCRYRVRAH